ncbi:MAG TPA: ribosomal protein L7/L12 [Woeseiaceae bacterium]|nr:ribosomal protein L7/L12 [Woeseiaceae bacterium]
MKQEVVLTEHELPAEVLQAIKQGRKVVAIKLLREATGIGLANAKVLVDRASARHAPRPPRQAVMRDYNPNNSRLLGMLLLVVLAFAAYKYFSGA